MMKVQGWKRKDDEGSRMEKKMNIQGWKRKDDEG